MAVTSEQIKSIAELGAKVIELQLSLADVTAPEAFHQIWPFAYCYGAFEALARHHGMDEVEAYLLITIGFEKLLIDRNGRQKLERAVLLQTNQFFVEGRQHGFEDLAQWMTIENHRPLTLMNFFSLGKPAARS